MKSLQKLATIALAIILMGSCTAQEEATTLKDALKDYFYIGTALNVPQVAGQDPQAIEIVKTHFNSVVAENCMKMMYLQPEEGVFFWDEADAFIEFAEANDMQVIGHTLVWHSQAPRWMFVDENGDQVSRERLIERMKTHVQTVVERYKGRVHGWDVVNETILDDGSWRQSPWVRIIGPEFVQMAFEFAHEIDPDVELYYNDYSVSRPEKRDGIYNMVKDLIDNGVKIDAVGLQGHLSMDFPTVEMKEEALQKLASLGVKVMVTEMDITVLPWPSRRHSAEVSLNYEISDEYNPYPNGLSEESYTALMDKYVDFFEMFMRNKDIISRVTVWGVDDNQSWRNNWPIRGRTDYPLLFDRDYQPKSAVTRIIELANAKKQ